MRKIIDNWFTQKDVMKSIDSHNNFSGSRTLLYKSQKSAFEIYTYISIPIDSKKLVKIVEYPSWDDDHRYTRKNLLMLRGNQFLSLSFRRYFDIQFGSNLYFSDSGIIYGECKEREYFGTTIKECYVLTEALIEYLNATSQKLLFGIQSHRFSERKLIEFELGKRKMKFQSPVKNYTFNVQSTKGRMQIFHKQIKSMSYVFGKYYVPNI